MAAEFTVWDIKKELEKKLINYQQIILHTGYNSDCFLVAMMLFIINEFVSLLLSKLLEGGV